MREIISIHLGQAGVQVGYSCLELFCLEHGIDLNGIMSQNTLENSSGFFKTFFSEAEPNKFTPRSVFVDLEPTAIDEIRMGNHRELFNPEQLVSGKEDAANNYARGQYTIGKEMISHALDSIRKLSNSCENLQGFIIFNSIGGGTGSGFGNLLTENLCVDYGKKINLSFSIFPSSGLSTSITETYNSIFGIHSQLNYVDCAFILDNEAIYEMSQKKLNIERPTYTNINRIAAQVISSITSPMRFSGSLNEDLAELEKNLVPYDRLKFMLTSQNPFIPIDAQYNNIYTSSMISESAFE
ncbi:hypothetical protein SteCoe_32572 [Stentor coeruleus]|uniref:Tubulin alpha chain n=1 Tax=Stentor coeruleus TaxID=5963 RepID=A0A1R2AYS1_9CILI|nr:hypothetical protein SteCoe_32572 [Stentor coeruleus]